MATVLRIVGLISGEPTGFDGQYVVAYDPGRNGVDPLTGARMMAHLVTTPDIGKAARFEPRDAIELWRRVDPRCPVRPDGKPNRPLTAFTVLVDSVDLPGQGSA